MAIRQIGFASQFLNGTWGPVFATDALATRWMREQRPELDSQRLVVPVWIDVPDSPPRPIVTLASGERVRYNLNRSEYIVVANGTNTPCATIVDIVRRYGMTDAELDSLQALPAVTDAWASAGGRD
jgi:hypothetical protein